MRKNDIRSFGVRVRRTRAVLFQKATLATAAGGGRREQGLAPRSAIGEAACPPMTEPGTARGSQGFAFLKIRKGDAAARWAAASRETLSRDFPMRREAAFVQAAAGKRVSRQTERAAAKEIVLRKNDIRSFRVRIRRTRAAIFQKATLATAAGGGRREQGLAPRSAIGEAACPPMTEPGTARGSQGFAFLKIRKGDAAARWAAASRETPG